MPRGERPERATPPLKLPIGQRVYRTIVEVEDPEVDQAGHEVDVWHVTLGDEGPIARPLLRRMASSPRSAAPAAASDVVEPPAGGEAPDEAESDQPELPRTR